MLEGFEFLKDYEQYLKKLQKAEKIVLSTHKGPDVDGLGCEIGLYEALNSLGKRVHIINEHSYATAYRFIDPDGIIKQWKSEYEKVVRDADLVVALDSSTKDRIGKVLEVAEKEGIEVLSIDHHPVEEDSKEGIIRPDFSSASELLAGIIYFMDWPINKKAATALYSGILYDTRMFRYIRNNPRSLIVGAWLIKQGADAQYAQDKLFGSIPVDRLKLLSRVVERMNLEVDGKLAWSMVDNSMLKGLNVDSADLREMISYLISLEGVKVAVFFRPGNNGVIKVSLRAKPPYRVDQVAQAFGGGGHRLAAGCDVKGDLESITEEVLSNVRKLFYVRTDVR